MRRKRDARTTQFVLKFHEDFMLEKFWTSLKVAFDYFLDGGGLFVMQGGPSNLWAEDLLWTVES